MKTLQVVQSPLLDNLIGHIGGTIIEEDVESLAQGYKKLFGGRGWNFGGYRKYCSGDDAKDIDWKASLRSNQILIKEYLEVRNVEVFFLLDASSSMFHGSSEKLKIEQAGELVLSLSYSMVKKGFKVGVGVFSDKLQKVLFPNSGLAQFKRIADLITDETCHGGGGSLQHSVQHFITQLKNNTILILVSDFIHLGEKWESNIHALGEKFNLWGIMVRDPIERELPRGIHGLFIEDPETGEKHIFHVKKYRKLYAERVKKQEQRLRGLFNIVNADFLLLTTDIGFLDPLIKFIIRREKISQ